jgi:hypothetical protein
MAPRTRLAYLAPLAVLALAIGLIVNSPYERQEGSGRRLLATSVDIDAEPDSVYRFLGDPANLDRWSGYVHHCAPLNADSLPEGALGSRRRCFCAPDGAGRRWDETLVEAVPGKKRGMALHDFAGFSAAPDSLVMEQSYATLGNGGCRLTFSLYFPGEPGWRETLQMYFAAYSIKGIFARDLARIKRVTESES